MRKLFLRGLLPLMLTCLLPATAAAVWADGSYQDVGEGYHGKLVVTVVIRGGKIESVTAESRADPPDDYLQTALDGLAPALVAANGADGVDAVSGATGSSNGILEAMRGVLKQSEASVRPAAELASPDAAPEASPDAAVSPEASPDAEPSPPPEGLGYARPMRFSLARST